METRRKFTSTPSDYATNVEWLNRKGYKFNVTWDSSKELFHFEYEADENYYIACMNDLADMRNSFATSYEEKDSLNTGISAIKTLMEMGVLK